MRQLSWPVSACASELGGKLFGHTARTLPVTTRDAHDVAIQLVKRVTVELAQPASYVLGGGALVREAGKRALLLGPCRGAFLRHHHELIPTEQHLEMGEIRQLGHATAQLL